MSFIANYLEFILESVSKKKMRLYYSDSFRNYLKMIQDKSDIAKQLLSDENSDKITDIYTLIDITDKNDTISFIQVNRIIKSNTDLSNTLPSDIFDKNSGSNFWSSGRTEMKIGRWVKRLFTEVYKSNLSDSNIEKFVNQYKAIHDMSKSYLEIVTGEDIRKWYLSSNYEAIKGQLGNSCMRYKHCQGYLDIYVRNPEVCSLLIMKSKNNPNSIVGRSLIWKLTDGTYYQDRIYTIYDSDKQIFEDWANNNGYLTYYNNSKYIEVELGNYEYSQYPYMDTFICYNPTTKLLSNDSSLWPDNDYYLLENTDGGFLSNNVVYSSWHGEYIPREDAVFCDNINDWLDMDNAIYLNYKGIWAAPDDDIVEIGGDYYFIDDCVFSDLMGEWLYEDDDNIIQVITDDYGDTTWCLKSRPDLYIKIDNHYYSRENYIKDPFTNDYKFMSNEYVNELVKKLMNDVGIEINNKTLNADYRLSNDAITQIIEELKIMLIKLELSDDIRNEIIQNDNYKKIKKYSYSIGEDYMPDEQDIFAIIKVYITENKTSSYIKYLNNFFKFYKVSDMEKYELKLNTFYTKGIMKEILNICSSFDYSKLPDDIYKRYLLIYTQ